MEKIQAEYPIFIGAGLLEKINSFINIAKYSKAVIITDKNIPLALIQSLRSALIIASVVVTLDDGEQNKDIKSIKKIWQTLQNFGCDRKSLVINLGGGMIGDIGGFAASTFMRGIDFLQIPTTLLSQVDASVGGKVGINFEGIKNLIGSFQQPVAVVIDIDALSTLPQREFISGFAEIIKHGLIADKEYFQLITSKKPQDFSKKELVEIIKKSCQIKLKFVTQDEKESGPRKLLNFGHTIGHAIESLSQETQNPLFHGEAISIGMAIEAKISNLLGLLSNDELERIKQALIQVGLPTTSQMPADKIIEKIKSDKKNEKGKTNWTLLKCLGKAMYDQDVDQSIVDKVL